jgi:15-hydroxyprostaglandin dehydrogenase (NAD)
MASASGMGLGVVERLVERGWNVAIVDFDDKMANVVVKRLGEKTIFIKTNVINYEQQAEAFAETFKKWNRLDLVFANAGFTDRVDIFEPAKEFLSNGAPKQPDALVVDVCLYGCIWSSYLALHYFRKNPDRNGKLVMTSSMCGLYATDAVPLYTAAKHGVSVPERRAKNIY